MKTMGQIIRELREERKMSQTKLGELIGVSKNAISHYERNTRTPSDEYKEAICDVFNIDMDYLYGKTEIKNKYQIDVNDKEYNFPNKIGERITQARESKGMAEQELATLLGLRYEQVIAMESGINRSFNNELLTKLAHALNVKESYFLNENYSVDVGKNIECLRLMSDISVHDMAILTNTEVSRIIKVENGTPPTIEEIERVANFFNIPEQWIINFDFSSVMDDERVKLAFQIFGLAKDINKEQREEIFDYAKYIINKKALSRGQ